MFGIFLLTLFFCLLCTRNVKPSLNDKFLTLTNLKAFADKINVAQAVLYFHKKISVGKDRKYWEKENILFISIFSIFHNVSKMFFVRITQSWNHVVKIEAFLLFCNVQNKPKNRQNFSLLCGKVC